ncbi:putative OsmC-like protein [Desulfobaculum xiamenense]|uniref:Putative OsmC-like protein n=1 Tax=Desulfobaculum xiamenense TaxID=995050 RepID=A0A846QJZ0_9BACT|nr:osmotically inducible protein OsmC [Desulfobaculum xiamenense]NJB66493.1 putative OsmC-like protein [Desulfobaculum xiamenense]
MAVNVTYERLDENNDLFTLGAQALPEIRVDYAALSAEDRNQEHMGARLLCMAALACYTNTFANSLKRKGAEIKFMRANATTSKDKDEVMRTKYCTLDITVEVGLDEQYREAFEEVKDNMLNGSLLTYSLEEAMDVDYKLSMVTA